MTIDKRPRYPMTCSQCGKAAWATLSVFQEDFGMPDCGHATCPACGTFLHLTFVPEKKAFETESWDDYLKRICDENRDTT
ncbi:MAG: hypothetical protein LBQ54_16025 [Planctomycetaceae bacterium]|jgi:hypothetical protein|nr:hypothetical protein [Planctomycetaceae bacterium]